MKTTKQLLACVSMFMLSVVADAQTNTFPSSGNVGVGTTTPIFKIDAYNSTSTGRVLGISRGYQALDNSMVNSFGTPYIAIGGNEYRLNSIQSIGFGYSTSGSIQAAEIGFVTTSISDYTKGDMVFATRNSISNIAPEEALRITSAGRVGLGTSSPLLKFDAYDVSSTNRVMIMRRGLQGLDNDMVSTLGNPYISIGANEYKSGSVQGIGFGYNTNGSIQPAEIAFQTKSATGYTSGDMIFANRVSTSNEAPTEVMRITNSANIGIGTTTPSEKLSVNGNIKADGNIVARKITATATGWPDYVFNPSYELKPLSEVASFIKANKHLPDVPSAKEVEANGISLGDNQALLLKKIEELTLYIIEMKEEMEQLKKKVNK